MTKTKIKDREHTCKCGYICYTSELVAYHSTKWPVKFFTLHCPYCNDLVKTHAMDPDTVEYTNDHIKMPS